MKKGLKKAEATEKELRKELKLKNEEIERRLRRELKMVKIKYVAYGIVGSAATFALGWVLKEKSDNIVIANAVFALKEAEKTVLENALEIAHNQLDELGY